MPNKFKQITNSTQSTKSLPIEEENFDVKPFVESPLSIHDFHDDFQSSDDEEPLSKVKLEIQEENLQTKLQEKKSNGKHSRKYCIYCDKKFATAREKREHKCKYLDCEEGFYICRICGKTLTRKNFNHHIHGTPPCKYCGMEILNPKRMALHIRIRHWQEKDSGYTKPFKYAKAVKGKVVCDYCGETFKAGVKHLKFLSHLYSHLPPEAFICTICNRNCRSMKLLRSHYNSKHQIKTFKCELCDKSYNQKNGMLLHQWNEHGYGDCEVCGQFIKSKEEMIGHMATHGNFECKRCQKSFLTPRRLKHHMDRHARMDENGGIDPVRKLDFF